MKNIGKNIREARIKSGLTQDELAGKLFVTRQTISNYEKEKSRPDIEMLEQIAVILGVELNELIFGLDNNTGPIRTFHFMAIAIGMVLILGELAKSIILLMSHTKYALQEGIIPPEEVAKSAIHFKLLAVANIIDRYLFFVVGVGFIFLFLLCFFIKETISWKKKTLYTTIILIGSFIILLIFSSIDQLYPFIEYAMPMFQTTATIIVCLVLSLICDWIRSKKKRF